MHTLWSVSAHSLASTSTDWDPDPLPADIPAEAALPGSQEQDLYRGFAAVVHGHGPAGSQHHLLPHEPGHAVQEGTDSFLLRHLLVAIEKQQDLVILSDAAVMMINHRYWFNELTNWLLSWLGCSGSFKNLNVPAVIKLLHLTVGNKTHPFNNELSAV